MALPRREIRTIELFAGAGGGILGHQLLGHRTVCAVEAAAYPRRVLLARQRAGSLPHRVPVWDDGCTFDGRPWRGRAECVSGGFPCTDISAAGKGAGIEGTKSSLWGQMARIVGEVRPRFVFVENSPLLVRRGLTVVLGDLAALGYDARWCVLGAHHVGAPHKRDRIWILARHPDSHSKSTVPVDDEMARMPGVATHSDQSRSQIRVVHPHRAAFPGSREFKGSQWWETEPDLGRVAHGVALRVDRLRAIGNGQVPAVAALAWRVLGGP